MCGITGIISTQRLSPEEKACLPRMTALLAHRGPDGDGHYASDHAALGHRRLAIIDVHGSRQPLTSEDGTIHAVVNGEFYDHADLRDQLASRGHRFATDGDSECLIHLYEERGEACVDSLCGMFAFALWDERRRTALLARDRLGVKPLYYHFDGRRLVFGSELKAVLAAPGVPREIDPTALIDYLTYGFIPSPKTIFKSICKLPPAGLLMLRDGRLTLRSYWDLHYTHWKTGSADSLTDEMWQTLRNATQRRLVTDVPIGAFLSGGLDSTAVVAAMAQGAPKAVTTITCGFNEQRFDERRFARLAAERIGTQHHETLVTPDIAGIADDLSQFFDEPFADASSIPTYYLSREARRRVTVALSGDGGDEVLAGYRRYRFDRYEEAVRRAVPAVLRRSLFGGMSAVYPNLAWLPRPLRAGSTLRNLATDSATGHGLSIATLSPASALRLLAPEIADGLQDYDPLDHVRELYNRCDAPDHLSKCQYVDIRCGLADGILTKIDRASMAHGLEVRSPMLDHRFVEFAWTLPPSLRIRGSAGKYLLRRIVANRVDESLATRRKAGFEAPMDAWFAGPLRERFQDELGGRDGFISHWIDKREIKRLWDEHLSGRQRHGATLWKLMTLEAWARRYLRECADHITPPLAHPIRSDGSLACSP